MTKRPQSLNDLFVQERCERPALISALAEAFDIPKTNIFFEDGDTSRWDDNPAHAFVYRLMASDVSWKIDVASHLSRGLEDTLFNLAQTLESIVLYDAEAEEMNDGVVAYSPDRRSEDATLVYTEDDGDARYVFGRRPFFST